jgi:quinol monooxygenase YgiN
MSLIVAGSFRVPLEQLDAIRPHMAAVIAATRVEAACLAYSFAEDVQEPGLFRVFEVWRDQASLDAHFATPHMAAWKAARETAGFYDRAIKAYEIASERTV